MRLSEKAIEDLRAIYKKEFGEELTPDEAAEMGVGLLRLIRLLLRPLPTKVRHSRPDSVTDQ